MSEPTVCQAGTAYYATDGERRTRIYIGPEPALRAWDRGETWTEAEYAALTAIRYERTQRGKRHVR